MGKKLCVGLAKGQKRCVDLSVKLMKDLRRLEANPDDSDRRLRKETDGRESGLEGGESEPRQPFFQFRNSFVGNAAEEFYRQVELLRNLICPLREK